MATSRHIIIGDIHGCADALSELLRECRRTPTDTLISVGDLVDRGPDPAAVVRFFMEDDNALAILGNHEDKHVRVHAGELPPGSNQLVTELQMGEFYVDALRWFATLPTCHTVLGHFVCHAGVDWQHPLDAQPRNALLRGKVRSRASVESGHKEPLDWLSDHPSWTADYRGDTPVVYGHYSTDAVREHNNTIGLDTGAGGGKELTGAPRLTALILPERVFVSVPASDSVAGDVTANRRDEYEALKARHAEARSKHRPKKPEPRTRAAPMIVDGVELDGRWLMETHGFAAGPELGQALGRLKQAFEAGDLGTLADAAQILTDP